ncbi:MAG: hypothetical protein RR365_04935 [Bacteroides sp.]
MERFIEFICFLSSFCDCSLVAYKPSDTLQAGNPILQPAWTGDGDEFVFAFLVMSSWHVRGTGWECAVHLPGRKNYAPEGR